MRCRCDPLLNMVCPKGKCVKHFLCKFPVDKSGVAGPCTWHAVTLLLASPAFCKAIRFCANRPQSLTLPVLRSQPMLRAKYCQTNRPFRHDCQPRRHLAPAKHLTRNALFQRRFPPIPASVQTVLSNHIWPPTGLQPTDVKREFRLAQRPIATA